MNPVAKPFIRNLIELKILKYVFFFPGTMSHCLLLLSCSWIGSVSLQFIVVEPRAETYFDNSDLPYLQQPPTTPLHYPRTLQDTQPYSDNYNNELADYPNPLIRKSRDIREDSDIWPQNQINEGDNTGAFRSFIIQSYTSGTKNNSTHMYTMDKRNFSPWGGKRADQPILEQMRNWRRATSVREPSMPKRVRFSPWGGKRSGHLFFKPGQKGNRVIYSTLMPELTRLISSYYPNEQRIAVAGVNMMPMMGKRYPMNLMAMSTKLDNAALREAMPFKSFLENLPRLFKVGHPYSDINLKKDGKRKVKFSAWGGKRALPIIGPVWTPAPDEIKDSTLNTIMLIKNSGLNTKGTN